MNQAKNLEIEKRNLRLNDVIEKYNRKQKIIVLKHLYIFYRSYIKES